MSNDSSTSSLLATRRKRQQSSLIFEGGSQSNRFDRQTRIKNWDQNAIEETVLYVMGDTDAEHFFGAAAGALGYRKIFLHSPKKSIVALNFKGGTKALLEDLECDVNQLQGYAHSEVVRYVPRNITACFNSHSYGDYLAMSSGTSVICDFSESDFTISSFVNQDHTEFLKHFKSKEDFPRRIDMNPLLNLIAAGIALEETKQISFFELSGSLVTDYSAKYDSYLLEGRHVRIHNKKILMVGAGALGNFTAMSLGLVGKDIEVTIVDPDTVDFSNLNRQILFTGQVGKRKADLISQYLKTLGIKTTPKFSWVDYPLFKQLDEEVGGYDAIICCPDNDEVRYVLSKAAEEKEIPFVTGASSWNGGNAFMQIPRVTERFYETKNFGYGESFEKLRSPEAVESRASCVSEPNPSVIMPNMIFGTVIVDMLASCFSPHNYSKIAYSRVLDPKSRYRMGVKTVDSLEVMEVME